jgi:hypothetical protein
VGWVAALIILGSMARWISTFSPVWKGPALPHVKISYCWKVTRSGLGLLSQKPGRFRYGVITPSLCPAKGTQELPQLKSGASQVALTRGVQLRNADAESRQR